MARGVAGAVASMSGGAILLEPDPDANDLQNLMACSVPNVHLWLNFHEDSIGSLYVK